MIQWLKTHWFLLTALIAIGSAWGQQQIKVESLEEAVKQNVATQQEIKDLKEQQARVDERTKAILEGQARQERLIELLLQKQHTNNQK